MSRELLKHHQKCTDPQCEVCTPVKNYVQRQRQVQIRQHDQLRQRQNLGIPQGSFQPGTRPQLTPDQIRAIQVWPLSLMSSHDEHLSCSEGESQALALLLRLEWVKDRADS